MRLCEVAGCDRKHLARGLCGAHYKRMSVRGDVGSATVQLHRVPVRLCEVAGCVGKHVGRGMCGAHLQRVTAHGSTDARQHYKWTGEDASYNAVHFRLCKERGLATAHPCVDCGGQAADWSYDWNAAEPKRDEKRRTYATDLTCYSARCKTCHRRLDAMHTRVRGCIAIGCDGVHKGRGMCSKHYQRWRAGLTT